MKRKILFTALITSLLTGLAGGVVAEEASETALQPMEQQMLGQPEVSGDGVNNATQVEDPSDIGREGLGGTDAPTPLPVEGDAGWQQVK